MINSENGVEEIEDESMDSNFMEMLIVREDDDEFVLKRKLRRATNLLGQVCERDRSTTAKLDRAESNCRELQVSIRICLNEESNWRALRDSLCTLHRLDYFAGRQYTTSPRITAISRCQLEPVVAGIPIYANGISGSYKLLSQPFRS